MPEYTLTIVKEDGQVRRQPVTKAELRSRLTAWLADEECVTFIVNTRTEQS